MALSREGTSRFYYEIYQETSTGDFGIEVARGPLFRCHTNILTRVPGFLGKVRECGKPRPRTVEEGSVVEPKEFFKERGYTKLLEDIGFLQFSQPIERSAFGDPIAKLNKRADPLKPGYTTALPLSGDTGAVKRHNPFFLAERYEVECECEVMCELLRFIYQGKVSHFDAKPRNQIEKKALCQKMLALCYDAERFSVDALFEQLLGWFGARAFIDVGERNFADAFYHLEHFKRRCTEEHSRNFLIETVTGDMLAGREQFKAVTRDARWASLPVEFVENILNFDHLPISSESEVLNLIERWNAKADQPRLVRLLCCFRPDGESRQAIVTWLTGMGWLTSSGEIPEGLPEIRLVKRILDGSASKGKAPRRNRREAEDLSSTMGLLQLEDNESPEAAQRAAAAEATFVHYKGASAAGTGSSFSIGAQQRLVQADVIRKSGLSRLRLVLSNPRRLLWHIEHEVFVGLSFGDNKYFGFLCSATSFSGIFSVRALSSAAPEPGPKVHLTGSGNKVEFDLVLEVQLQRVNKVVVCKLSVILDNVLKTDELFQIANETLTRGSGLRFQVVGTGLGDDEVDVQLSWVSGGGGPGSEEEMAGTIDIID
eukprot:CAMPEP_0170598818 /NCGR_PEP_ID=MMETSP0224-20130122/16454_1 /TAXON_ID=285029 /ORGANISM="Togula jolla, Strain CCCM 725" /LENGTH=597 /DNA_ID=CAMNT_0010923403 /DNA_START=24 /DNA_END=1817 /DNA_ORIENTATION=-